MEYEKPFVNGFTVDPAVIGANSGNGNDEAIPDGGGVPGDGDYNT